MDESEDPNLDFSFPSSQIKDENNGLLLNQIALEENILILIFSYVPITNILDLGLVCKKWYNIIKMHSLWSTIYFRKYEEIPKILPWYTFYALFRTQKFFVGNILKNNSGQEHLNHWKYLKHHKNNIRIEINPDESADSCPLDCPDFNEATTYFEFVFGYCTKSQRIPLEGNLIKYIVEKHKPHIYASEWVKGRLDYGGNYVLIVTLYSKSRFKSKESKGEENEGQLHRLAQKKVEYRFNTNEGRRWHKVEVVVKNYRGAVSHIKFEHSTVGDHTRILHYGIRMTGGVVRLLFDSIKPAQESARYEVED